MKSDTYVNFAGEIFQNFRRLVYTVTLKMNDDYLIIVGTFLFFPHRIGRVRILDRRTKKPRIKVELNLNPLRNF